MQAKHIWEREGFFDWTWPLDDSTDIFTFLDVERIVIRLEYKFSNNAMFKLKLSIDD